MFLHCVSNTPLSLPIEQRPVGNVGTSFPLTVGRGYAVAGMSLALSRLTLLVRADWGTPLFLPAGLFERLPTTLPADWVFSIMPGMGATGAERWSDPIEAIWGYPELVMDPNWVQLLIEEADAGARKVFNSRIDEIEVAQAQAQVPEAEW